MRTGGRRFQTGRIHRRLVRIGGEFLHDLRQHGIGDFQDMRAIREVLQRRVTRQVFKVQPLFQLVGRVEDINYAALRRFQVRFENQDRQQLRLCDFPRAFGVRIALDEFRGQPNRE
ncbi:hypothetical protein Pan258_46100 [Symmachiella dynata]|nr:hypothetical protein Pan258_46100 [Symmachiella dynata]